MVYTPPYIDENGLHISSYEDILNYLLEQARSIFGQDIYLGEDSQDYQMISVHAQAIRDSHLAAQDSYNSRSPGTSFGKTLDGNVSINGIKRKPSSKSTASVVITGTPFTVINNGVVENINGDRFDLPDIVTIEAGGTVTVTATAQGDGAIASAANTITNIVTPTFGWESVTNPNKASEGLPVEQDNTLKSRREKSVAIPSQTPLESYEASVSAVSGVTDYKVYENDTSSPDENYTGEPANSVTVIAEGGAQEDIAQAIATSKNLGVYTAGDIITEIVNEYGTPQNYRFYRPTYQENYTEIKIKALSGYTSEVADQIIQSIDDYISKLKISYNLYRSQLWEAALSVSPDLRPYFNVRDVLLGSDPQALTTDDRIAGYKDKFTSDGVVITILT